MVRNLVKVQKNKNITLPLWAMKRLGLDKGDYLTLEETSEGLLLKPAKLVDPWQVYFWSPAWQKGEREAQEDIRTGRVKGFRSIRDLMKDLRS